jgi:polyisoprenoid-binding protein YceI
VLPARRCIEVAVLTSLLAAQPALATEWKIDAAKSWLGFKGTMAGAPFEGRFRHWQGRISFDPARPDQGRAAVTIDMTSAQTGDPQKDAALPRSEWFAAKSFPAADFEVQSFQSKGGNSYEAIGTLTIRDVTKHVAMPVTIDASGASLHAVGHLDLLRSDYGVGQGTWASGQWVGLGVTAQFDVTAERSN